MMSANKLIRLINQLNWKNPDHNKSQIEHKRLHSLPSGSRFFKRKRKSSVFNCAYRFDDNDIFTELDLFVSDIDMDFISLQFHYNEKDLSKLKLESVSVTIFTKNGTFLAMPSIKKGKCQVLDALKSKIREEKNKRQKRESASKIRQKRSNLDLVESFVSNL